MNSKAKLAAYNTMKAPQHGSKDYDHLKHLASHHKLVQKPYVHSDRLANEIFYALLDFATPDEIKQNRRGEKKDDHSELAKKSGSLTAQLKKAETIEAANDLFEQIKEIAAKLPEELTSKFMDFPTSIHTKKVEQLKEATAVLVKETSEKSLLKTDLEKLDYKDQKAFIKDLGIEPENFKAVTLHAALLAYKAELESKLNNPENDVTNQDEIVEDLQDKVEGLEDENENLQEQVDDLQSENEDLKAQPGADKKKDSPKSENTQK